MPRTYLKLQFYADRIGQKSGESYRNRLFSFDVDNESNAVNLLIRFVSNGNRLRACFLNEYSPIIGNIEPVRRVKMHKNIVDQINKGQFST